MIEDIQACNPLPPCVQPYRATDPVNTTDPAAQSQGLTLLPPEPLSGLAPAPDTVVPRPLPPSCSNQRVLSALFCSSMQALEPQGGAACSQEGEEAHRHERHPGEPAGAYLLQAQAVQQQELRWRQASGGGCTTSWHSAQEVKVLCLGFCSGFRGRCCAARWGPGRWLDS